MTTFVYVISGDHGRQKIGISDEPRRRIKELQTGSPYPLKFEFVGECENGSAGQIEVETHFTLNAHKAPGGDEWFAVPSDVAITAVMAAAHRLGYRIKPVDPDQITPGTYGIGRKPLSYKIASVLVFAPLLYFFYTQITRVDAGTLDLGAFAIEGAVLLLIGTAARWVLAKGFAQIGEAFVGIDRAMHPENGEKAPLSLD